ncbi:hypothetical protein DIPPA_12761, partial [Diplonema papillatum]
ISMPTIEVGTVSQQWKQTEALWKALHWWIGKLCWAHIGSEHTVTFLELAVDFELTTGERLPDVSDRRIQPPTMRKTKTTTAREILPPSEAQSGLCLYFDGGSRQNGTALAVAGAGAVVYEDGKKIAEVIVPLGRTTNNVAEFSALVGGLHLLGEQPPSVQGPVTVRGDSKVVISTMKKTAQCKPILRPYLLQATASMGALAPRFNFNLEHVARDRNTDADALSNAAMDQVQAQTSGEVSTVMAQYEAYRRSALAKARTLHRLANTAARIYGTAWHPGRVANVTSATALGGGVMQGVSCRAVLSPQTEAVLRSMSRGASDTEGTTPNPFVKAHERQEKMLADFRRSALGEAHSLVEMGKAYKKVTGQPWFYGHEYSSTVLTSLGGTVVRGVSRRAQLSEATEGIIVRIREHAQAGIADEHESSPYPPHLNWAATFLPEEAYPAGWIQGKPDWKGRTEEAERGSSTDPRKGAPPRRRC